MALLVVPLPAQADEVSDFLGKHGCVIGPGTRDAALKAGFAEAAVDQWMGAIPAENWQMVDDCTITPPDITPILKLTDPEVQASFSSPDQSDEVAGCFLDNDLLREELQRRRGWSADKALTEYIALVGASLVSGEMAFYDESLIILPGGFTLLTGTCGDAFPKTDDARENHAFMIENFDALIRKNAEGVSCKSDTTWNMDIAEYAADLSQSPRPNAWIGMELWMIGTAAGWREGMTMTSKGMPRPPACHY